MKNNLKFAWSKYYPWYFLADIVIWSVIAYFVLSWVLR